MTDSSKGGVSHYISKNRILIKCSWPGTCHFGSLQSSIIQQLEEAKGFTIEFRADVPLALLKETFQFKWINDDKPISLIKCRKVLQVILSRLFPIRKLSMRQVEVWSSTFQNDFCFMECQRTDKANPMIHGPRWICLLFPGLLSWFCLFTRSVVSPFFRCFPHFISDKWEY